MLLLIARLYFQFVDKIAKKYKQDIVYHKSCKLFIADNMSPVKQAHHCEPFSLKIGGFCAVESSEDFTVDFMNKRYHWINFWPATSCSQLHEVKNSFVKFSKIITITRKIKWISDNSIWSLCITIRRRIITNFNYHTLSVKSYKKVCKFPL